LVGGLLAADQSSKHLKSQLPEIPFFGSYHLTRLEWVLRRYHMRDWKHIWPLVCIALLLAPVCAFSQKPLASKEDYQKYIEPLLQEKDFGTHYVEDGAADASVLTPMSRRGTTLHLDRPSDPVIRLVRLGAKSLPLLIDCLSDGRIASIRFDGNTITKPMNVPVGYVCLDILMGSVRGSPVSVVECGYDGLGGCMNLGFYFRPDDYRGCLNQCEPRPWVTLVQRNWRQQFLQNRLRFQNFYDSANIPEYKEFMTPKK
jgi:hypothetical protein